MSFEDELRRTPKWQDVVLFLTFFALWLLSMYYISTHFK